MGVYNFLAEKMLYQSMDLMSGSTVSRNIKELNKTQWMSNSELIHMQNKKFLKLINYAYQNVPFYRKKWKEAGVKIEEIKSINDITKLPIIYKKDVKSNTESIKSKKFSSFKTRESKTGGTTGTPMSFYLQRESWSMIVAGVVRGRTWSGYRLGDKYISIGGSSIIPDEHKSSGKKIWKNLERHYGISALGLSPLGIENYIKFIQQNNIRYLRGYPSAIYIISKYISENDLHIPNIKAIFTTAEVLNDSYRTHIESTFQTKIFDEYGVRDGGCLAMECDAHQGLHITCEKGITESMDNNGNNTTKIGELVHTDLYNYAFPFIRYNVEDLGTISFEKCGCGRELPRIISLEGRTTDIISFSNGIVWSGPALIHIFKDFDLCKYQLIEKSKDNIRVLVIPGKTFDTAERNKLTSILAHNAGPDVLIEIEDVESIKETKSGKMKVIISKENST